MIDRSGEWWTGTGPEDIDDYLRELTEEGYPADRFEHARCTGCGGTGFELEVDDEQGCARRTCAACRTQHFICDSEEFSSEAELSPVTCPCGRSEFEIAVGFSHRDDRSVRWITVGMRCVSCGVLGSPVDWEIDYEPTGHLYLQT